MARKYALTYHKARKCWRKVYRAKTFYLGPTGVSKTDDEGYQAALGEWEAVKRHADGEGPEPYTAAGIFDPDDYQRRYGEYLMRQSEAQLRAASGSNGDATVGMATNYSKHSFTPPAVAGKPSSEITIAELIKLFMEQRRQKAESGQISVKMYAQDKAKLDDFEGFCRHHDRHLARDIDAMLIDFYRQAQLALMACDDDEDSISGWTAKKRLRSVAVLLKWAYKREYIDRLPRNLDGEFAAVKIDRPEPTFWTPEEVRTLFNAASPRTKCYIALAANCGYTQAEISTLEWEMIDRKQKVIRRQRPKTDQDQVHSIWPVTWALLKQESKSKTGLVLTTVGDQPLLRQGIKEDGNVTHLDCVRLAVNRTLKKTKMSGTGRTFKSIRKTSGNAIRQEYEDNRLVDIFLAHSTKGDMRDHYTQQSYKKYFEALEWLEGYYELKL